MTSKFTLIDLFCGAGGMTLGFASKLFNDCFTPVLAIDNNPTAIETYNANFGNNGKHGVCADIETWLSENSVPTADVVIGGPPCQGFSLLNKNRDNDHRRALWEPYMEIVAKSGASLFVMENVPGLLKSAEFELICTRANALGFDRLHSAILNTADYGVPQTRRRAIVLGIKSSNLVSNFSPYFPPEPTHCIESKNPGGLKNWNTVFDAIGDLPEPKGTEIRTDMPAPLNLHFGRSPTPKSVERYRAVPPGGNRFDLQKNRPDITPNCWIMKKSGGTDLFGRLWWERPSVTIRTEFFKPEKGRYLHPEQHRPITHREAARLMSFPDKFIFHGNKIEVARQIGNAVPPLFSAMIADMVASILENRVASSNRVRAA